MAGITKPEAVELAFELDAADLVCFGGGVCPAVDPEALGAAVFGAELDGLFGLGVVRLLEGFRSSVRGLNRSAFWFGHLSFPF